MSEKNAAILELENTLEDLRESEKYWLDEIERGELKITQSEEQLKNTRAASAEIQAALEILRKAE